MNRRISRAVVRIGMVIGLASAAACSGDATTAPDVTAPATVDEFLADYARLLCEKVRVCDSAYAVYSQAQCEQMVRADLASGTLDRRLDAGALAYDRQAATACLTLLAASPACAAEGWSDDYCFEDGAIVGAVGVGGSCTSETTWICAPGTRCSVDVGTNACGTCDAIVLADLGEPCTTTSDCRQTASRLAYCDYDAVDARDECIAWANPTVVGVGATCDTGDVVCDVGADCAWNGDGLCHARIAIGAECDPNGDVQCVGGAPCIADGASSLGGICRELALATSVGADCGLVGTQWVECDRSANLGCDPKNDTCFDAGAIALGNPCSDGTCAAGLFCDYSAITPVCATQGQNGDPCNLSDGCVSGLCVGTTPNRVCSSAAGVSVACGI